MRAASPRPGAAEGTSGAGSVVAAGVASSQRRSRAGTLGRHVSQPQTASFGDLADAEPATAREAWIIERDRLIQVGACVVGLGPLA
jgi:hypothetical protein